MRRRSAAPARAASWRRVLRGRAATPAWPGGGSCGRAAVPAEATGGFSCGGSYAGDQLPVRAVGDGSSAAALVLGADLDHTATVDEVSPSADLPRIRPSPSFCEGCRGSTSTQPQIHRVPRLPAACTDHPPAWWRPGVRSFSCYRFFFIWFDSRIWNLQIPRSVLRWGHGIVLISVLVQN